MSTHKNSGDGAFIVAAPGGAHHDELWFADIRTDGRNLSASKPRLLFKVKDYAMMGPTRAFHVSLDGQHFRMVKLNDRKPQPVTELVFVQNWLEELKRLAPATKK